MIRLASLALLLLPLLAACGDTAPSPDASPKKAAAHANLAAPAEPVPDVARVRLTTTLGDIVLELNGRRAPITTGNFLAYVDRERFDGMTFYRAARTRNAPERGFVQGGLRSAIRGSLPPIAHEPTSETGLRHLDATISMARRQSGVGAIGDFFITVGAMPSMDADSEDPGYAAFGRVVEGMDVVRRILASETVGNAGGGAMRGQILKAPVTITRARREP
jgi:peptidyl-prolyl cis-trans isomerase A (cyclophilin A)